MQAGIFVTMAQFDNDLRSERTIEGMSTAIKAGKWVHNPA